MDEETHSRGKKGIPASVWMGVGIILVGILIGSYLSPILEPIIHPDRASLVENAQALKTQNTLLKQQIDCLVNGINQNHGKTTVTECT